MACDVCNGKHYIVSVRDDNGEARDVIERCDNCWGVEHFLQDHDAAKLAQRDGIRCEPDYPCYVLVAS